MGYDVHRLHPGHPVVLGGVSIPYAAGFVAYADGDPLSPAVVDAILGAISPGEDMADRFPDTDPRNEKSRSLDYLYRIPPLLHSLQATIHNVDMVVEAEQPKLKPHFPVMRHHIAEALAVALDQGGIKGKTSEGAGYLGRGEAIAVRVVALIGR